MDAHCTRRVHSPASDDLRHFRIDHKSRLSMCVIFRDTCIYNILHIICVYLELCTSHAYRAVGTQPCMTIATLHHNNAVFPEVGLVPRSPHPHPPPSPPTHHIDSTRYSLRSIIDNHPSIDMHRHVALRIDCDYFYFGLCGMEQITNQI